MSFLFLSPWISSGTQVVHAAEFSAVGFHTQSWQHWVYFLDPTSFLYIFIYMQIFDQIKIKFGEECLTVLQKLVLFIKCWFRIY